MEGWAGEHIFEGSGNFFLFFLLIFCFLLSILNAHKCGVLYYERRRRQRRRRCTKVVGTAYKCV